MAHDDLISLQVNSITDHHVEQCSIGLRSFSPDPLWYELAADEFIDAIAPTWYSGLSEEIRLNNVTVVDVYPGTRMPFVVVPITPIVGGVLEPSLPAQVAGLISYRSDEQGRSFRGRMYVGGVPVSAIGNDQGPSADFQDYLLTLGGEIFSLWNAANPDAIMEWVTITRSHNGVVRTRPLGAPVMDIRVGTSWGTQRRRIQAFH